MPDIVVMGFKLLLSALLGGFVGYERELHEHPAGLRTHILVCMGAALMTMVSVSFGPREGSDPARIAAQIVSGIGFLGAGTILRQGSIVRGLTTAASLWTVAGIGMAVGIGGAKYYWLATFGTGIVFITLSTMRGIEPSLGKRTSCRVYLEALADEPQVIGSVVQKLTGLGAVIQSVTGAEPTTEGRRAFRLSIALPRRLKPEAVIELLASHAGLERFECT